MNWWKCIECNFVNPPFKDFCFICSFKRLLHQYEELEDNIAFFLTRSKVLSDLQRKLKQHKVMSRQEIEEVLLEVLFP